MTVEPEQEGAFMAMALELAAEADHSTSPGPMVGCVVVAGGEVVGRGFARGGEVHAEIVALADAGPRARGATVYVTLEPCSHPGGNPSCTEALIAAGVERVVVPTIDPNPVGYGRGMRALEDAGIAISIGVLENPAWRLNEFFFTHLLHGRPFVTARFASSLDGRTPRGAMSSGEISGSEARAHSHRLRHIHDAVLVGVGTVIADDPSLTTHDAEATRGPLRSPRPVILDSRLRTPTGARVVDRGAMIYTVSATPHTEHAARAAALRGRGAEVIAVAAGPDGRPAIGDVLADLANRGTISLLVEGGRGVLGAVFDAGVVDRVVAYLTPHIVGGDVAPLPVGGRGVAEVGDAGRLNRIDVARRGDDVVVSGYCVR